MRPILMRLRFHGTCCVTECGKRLLEGTLAYFQRPRVWCAAHGSEAGRKDEPDKPQGQDQKPQGQDQKPQGQDQKPQGQDQGQGRKRPERSKDPGVNGVRAPRASDITTIQDTTTITYLDPEGFLADACQIPHEMQWGETYRDITQGITLKDDDNIEFFGGRSPSKRIRMLQGFEPWTEGLRLAQRYKRDVGITGHIGSRRETVWGSDGSIYDRAREEAGYQDCYRTTRRTQAKGARIVRLVVNIGAHCGRKQESFIQNGASVAAAVDSLEDAGIRCEIWVVRNHTRMFRKGTPSAIALRVRIKAAEQPLNLENLTSWTAHLGGQRVSLFGWFMAQPRELDYGLGSPQDSIDRDILAYWAQLDGYDSFVWPFCRSREDAEKALQAIEAKL